MINTAKLLEISPKKLHNLKDIIKQEWPNVLKNLPPIKTGKLKLTDESLKRFENSDEPAKSAIDYMISKAIKISDLEESFEALDFEQGLLFLEKPVVNLKLTRYPKGIITAKNNKELVFVCHAEGFPKPTYEYYKDEHRISSVGTFRKIVSFQDSGDYKCIISQNRGGAVFTEHISFKVEISKEETFENLTISLPVRQEANLGQTISIVAVTNSDHSLLKFEWYKYNGESKLDEVLYENSTFQDSILKIENFDLSKEGIYKCQLGREATNEKIFSKKSEIISTKLSQFDLKIALIIGNSHYERDNDEIQSCRKCKTMTPSYNLIDLNLSSAFDRLKKRLEHMGYLVMSFLDLDAESYLRALYVTREICDKAKNVSVLIYVAGHGHNYDKEDYFIPIDTKMLLHENDHAYRRIRNSLNLCSLSALLENFKPRYAGHKISVICFWDLCRRAWVECPSDIDPSFKENLNYSIMFCCNIGKNGYELDKEIKEFNLERGPIFLNVLLNNLKSNLTLHDIGIRMKSDIQQMKQMHSSFEKLNNLIFFSTLESYDLSDRSNRNSEFESDVKKFYIGKEAQITQSYFYKETKLLDYKFIPDTFINSILLEIETVTTEQISYDLNYHPLLSMDMVETSKCNVLLFRIRNFLAMKNLNLKLPIQLLIIRPQLPTTSVNIHLPDDTTSLYQLLNTQEIDMFIEEKRRLDISDEISVSSYDVENESFENTSNDEYNG